jgi:membrane protein implicated in regulation of membrane protease activity
VLKNTLRFVGECVIVLGILFAFALWLAIGIAGCVAYCTVVLAQNIPRLFGLAVAGVLAILLWIAYRLSSRHEESENDDYAY